MRSVSINDYFDEIFRDLNRVSLGFEPTLRMLDQVRHTSNQGYPPYDLEQLDETGYRISMAVAGFTPEELDITLKDGLLTIEGTPNKEDSKTYLHKGIAGRAFKRAFYLNAWMQVTGSNLSNGILTIDFKQELPDNMKPKKIAIQTTPVVKMINNDQAA